VISSCVTPPRMETMRFGQLEVRFDDRVLRPRPWTLAQSHWAAELVDDLPAGPLLELCAGVGHIGMELASRAGRDLVLVDANPFACEHARFNALAADLSGGAEVRHGPMDAVIGEEEAFALVLADPPWVPSHDTARFPEDPRPAIDGGPDGLEVARLCVELTGRHLLPGGASVLQLGTAGQAQQIEEHVAARPDLALRVEEVRTGVDWDGVLVRLSSTRARDRHPPADARRGAGALGRRSSRY
jgi:methylase of polypeptide subunit release factors